MMKPKLRRLPLAAAAFVVCTGAHAGYQSPDGDFTLSGFGTLGVTKTTTDEAILNTPGARGGATKHASIDPDTKLALQGTYKFAPTFSATTQLMSRLNGEGEYTPEVEWAFASWQASPSLKFRLGRMGAPYFMISDFRLVGYANTSVRPNTEVYQPVAVSAFDGGDVTYQFNVGDATLTSTLWAGDSNTKYTSTLLREASDFSVKRTIGINFQAEFSNGMSLRLGHTKGRLYAHNSAGDDLRAFLNSPTGVGLKSALTSYGQTASRNSLDEILGFINPPQAHAAFDGIGVTYDQDQWIINSEYVVRRSGGFTSDVKAWYALVGYRINKFTPYAGFSKLISHRKDNPVVLSSTGNTTVDGGVATLRGQAQLIANTQKLDQHTFTVGSRWDVGNGVALKAQWDKTFKPADSGGTFLIGDLNDWNRAGSFPNTRRTIDVFSLSVDFVF